MKYFEELILHFTCDKCSLWWSVAISNTKWKKDIIGKGNASKLEIKAFAEKYWGETFEEQDFADAACIALWIKRKFESEKNNGSEKQEEQKRNFTKG